MDNPYVHGLRQHDTRPRAPIVVPNHMHSSLQEAVATWCNKYKCAAHASHH